MIDEMKIGTRVLDKGHISCLVAQAQDLDVVNAARVSFHAEEYEMNERNSGLIRFLMRERHGTPFEHGFFKFRVKAPLFVLREWHRHRVGHCLPGSSLITTQRNNDSKQRTIEELWRLANTGVEDSWGRTRLLPSCKHPSLRILRDDGEFDVAEALSIYKSGVKPIIKIVHEKGILRCTKEHRIHTEAGWRQAGQIVFGDRIGTVGRVWREEERSIPPALRTGIGVWTSMQRRRLINDLDTCYICGNSFPFDELELDHVVSVYSDLNKSLDINNLKPCCIACHSNKTYNEDQPSRKGSGRLGIVASKVIGVYPDGEEETYDIEMSGDIHNFVADGVVVHNSYNEWSARYSQLEPEFYIPSIENVVAQYGKPGNYEFAAIEDRVTAQNFTEALEASSNYAYECYLKSLEAGIAKQQARLFLPVNIYSQMIWSCNPRSLMHFLSLRNSNNAQAEIREYAQVIEGFFVATMPVTAESFISGGRVAP